jgi:hypothetical protein
MSIIDWVEDALRKLYRKEFMRKEKEKFLLIKSAFVFLLRIITKLIFYFILIAGGYLVTELIKTSIPPLLWLKFTLVIILLIVGYEYLDNMLEMRITKLKSKAREKYGLDYSKPHYTKDK